MLDKSQKKAVKISDRPVLVCAGPGSGKTRTLVYKVLYLLQQDVSPDNILMLTFTNKAAKEVRERIERMLYNKYKANTSSCKSCALPHLPFIGTIHSLCLKILKTESSEKTLLIDEQDQLNILKNLKSRVKYKGTSKKLVSLIGNYKVQPKYKISTKVAKIYKCYKKLLHDNHVYDYNDLQLELIKLLQKNKKLKQKYQSRFKHILVDEYQDINSIQDKIINILVKPDNRIFAIGDVDQSIYGFRGVDIKTFLKFKDEFKDAKVIKLKTNYRSTPSIVKASLSLIEHNKNRLDSKYKSIAKNDFPVQIIACTSHKDEAKFIVTEIERILGGTTLLHIDSGLSDQTNQDEYIFNDFAILYRKNSFTKYLEHELLHKGIPYQVIGTNSFWQKSEVRDVMSVLKYLTIESNLFKHQMKKLKLDITNLRKMSALVKHNEHVNISDLIKQSGIKKNYKNNDEAYNNLDKFINLASEFRYSSLEELLSKLSLQSRETYIDKRANCVKLSTLHQTKGLEFSNVFIAGCEEDFIPLLKQGSSNETLEEERRLFYVGMTRAKDRLFLTYTKNRLIWGKREKRQPSRFLNEVNNEFTEIKRFAKKRKKKAQIKLF